MRAVISVAIAVVCLGCEQSPANSIPAEEAPTNEAELGASGTRLKRRIMGSRDGAQQLIGWFDVQRQENCAFRQVAWNETRCIPSDNVYETMAEEIGAIYFSDSACSRPIVLVGAESVYDCHQGLISYAIMDEKITCKETNFRVFGVGGRLAEVDSEATVHLYSLRDGECAAGSEAEPANLYAELTEVPLSEFVEVSERVE